MHSTYKQGAALSVGTAVAGKVFSLANSLLIAFLFGASAGTDIYFYILLAAAVLNGWLQGVNAAVIVPQFMHLREKDERAAIGFANFFIYVYLAAAVLLTGVCFAFSESHFAWLGALYFSALFISGFLLYLAECYKLFKIYWLLPLNTLCALVLLVLTRKIEASMLGYTIGYFIIAIGCITTLKKSAGWDFGARRGDFGKKFAHDLAAAQPNGLAWAAMGVAPLVLIMQWPLAMTMVAYSRMLYESLIDIFTSKLNGVAKVKITAAAAAQEPAQTAAALKRTDIIVVFILAPVCAFTAFYAEDIIKLFFMRGSFSHDMARAAAYYLQIFILAVPLISLHHNFYNLLSALRLVKETALRYFTFALVFTAAFLITVKEWGPQAYPITFLGLYIMLMFVNIWTARQFAAFLAYWRHMVYMLKLMTISLFCAFAVCLWLDNLFISGGVFVLLNAFIFWVFGDVKKFKEAVNIKWKLR